ncbi:LPS O-antigen chain length determinant protein WzzB [Pseudomonas rubra]|uniref:Wzz/FepE/Etk N-terminal domain-containing protein n=1 Tax=Pseudomonas rubra TaxID=2942627 RepID=A0ABT5P605_9PSED|nr:Wzz/FepE/Etk N-terminal domain-containing protein [Pseudomonas rubra]MDD1013503.1 Wzz/FepE/Etk N-terminal domain-containing protein [Pseudomonas rubra]MDD1040179.1 Wzz/FepE/Etk N-terminal domain-containing protein [Pseudomonas rubra]MDD1155815.1 Wzz/FepE/Etk N-terminal domain-containing protein [Pseudomonas rubra]
MRNSAENDFSKVEVDIVALCGAIWAKKYFICSVVVIFFLAALVYLKFSRTIYETKIFVMPPTQNEIADFNYGRTDVTGLKPYSVRQVYDVFLRDFQGESLRRSFFERYYLPSLTEEERKGSQSKLYNEFSRIMVVSTAGKNSPDLYSLTVSGNSPEQVVSWAKAYVAEAGASAMQEMIKNVEREADVRARNVSQQIEGLRESGQKVREDQIVQLQEALNIAYSVGLKEPPIIGSGLSAEVTAGMDGALAYMQGSKALEAQIHNLEKRKSDDPFIAQLRNLQASYSLFSAVEVNPESVAVYRLDGDIVSPDAPVSPRKLFVIGVSLLLGLLVGVGIVMLQYLLRQPSGTVLQR